MNQLKNKIIRRINTNFLTGNLNCYFQITQIYKYILQHTKLFDLSVSNLIRMNSARIFASRNHIIEWINNLLKIEMIKIQQLGSGVIYCLLLDCAYPERVPISKLKWYANTEVDYIHNFKILQTSFCHMGIEKKIEINKLIKAKHQDNLDFIQWLKWFLQPKIQENTYDPKRRRQNKDVYLDFCEHRILKVPSQNSFKVKQNQLYKNKFSQKINKKLKKIYNTNDEFLEIFECRTDQSDDDCNENNFIAVQKKKMMRTHSNFRNSKYKFATLQKYIDKTDDQQIQDNKENAHLSMNNTVKITENASSLACMYASPRQIKKFYFPQRFSERLKRRVDVINEFRQSQMKRLGLNEDKQDSRMSSKKNSNIYIDELTDCQIQE